MPFTVKDGIPVAGLPNPMGVKKLAGEVARKDAAAVCSLRGAGAILLGKTNVPEFLDPLRLGQLALRRDAQPA